MTGPRLLVIAGDEHFRDSLTQSLLETTGYDVLSAEDGAQGLAMALSSSPDLIIAQNDLSDITALEVLAGIQEAGSTVPTILIAENTDEQSGLQALRLGIVDFVEAPLNADDLLNTIQNSIREIERQTQRIPQQDALSALMDIGQAITASLDLEVILGQVIEEAVRLTGAEEGLLMLLNPETEELFTRSSKSFDEDVVRNLRLPVSDSLAGQVVNTGSPLLIGEGEHKIKTEYLVKSLLYVPLLLMNQVIGVLGVSNRVSERMLTDEDVIILEGLATYAAIAIGNARSFEEMHIDRSRFRTMLEQSSDAMLVVDEQDYIVLINDGACKALELDALEALGRTVDDAISNADLRGLFERADGGGIGRGEVAVTDGRTFNAQLTAIEGMGHVMVMQDVTHLKELERMKTQFVTTVSHDLRSPLTGILGYAEFIGRAGEVNERQAEFIERVRSSVHAMTNLIDDLLDLGSIEAGMDRAKEPVDLMPILTQIAETLQASYETKNQHFEFQSREALPPVLGNPLRLRQAITNLVDNAIKYTPEGGDILLYTNITGEHIMILVKDSGVGIPLADQSHIFDQFYRAESVQATHQGTGLGLSIVKSIVESHEGRIWVDSQPDEGSTFTIMLPAYRPGEGLTDSPHAP